MKPKFLHREQYSSYFNNCKENHKIFAKVILSLWLTIFNKFPVELLPGICMYESHKKLQIPCKFTWVFVIRVNSVIGNDQLGSSSGSKNAHRRRRKVSTLWLRASEPWPYYAEGLWRRKTQWSSGIHIGSVLEEVKREQNRQPWRFCSTAKPVLRQIPGNQEPI